MDIYNIEKKQVPVYEFPPTRLAIPSGTIKEGDTLAARFYVTDATGALKFEYEAGIIIPACDNGFEFLAVGRIDFTTSPLPVVTPPEPTPEPEPPITDPIIEEPLVL